MSKITKWPALVCLFLTSLPSSRAQAPQEGFVTGTGTVEIKRLPELVRIHVNVLAKGKDLKEALAKLKERQEAAKLKLTALGATKETIQAGDPGVTSEKSDRQLEMERMVGERIRDRGGKKPAKDKEAPPVVVGLTLRAELPIKAASVEDLLVQFQALKEKVIAADLGGLKEMQKLSPKEEELAEENERPDRYREDDEPRKGEPQLLFVCKIPEEDRSKALADAFSKAKREAGRLAKAAGADLGALRHVQDQAAGGSYDDMEERMARYYSRNSISYRQSMTDAVDEGPAEAVGTRAGKVTLRIVVSASFAVKAGPLND
jgi:uncharacterized protein YggE